MLQISGVWTERDPSKDETQIGDQKALSLRTIHFLIWKILYILQVQIRRLKQRIRMPYIPPLLHYSVDLEFINEKISSFQGNGLMKFSVWKAISSFLWCVVWNSILFCFWFRGLGCISLGFGVGLGFFIRWIWYYSLCFRNRLRPHSLRWKGSYILFTQTKNWKKQIINFNCWMPGGILIVVIDPLGYWNHLFPSILASNLA